MCAYTAKKSHDLPAQVFTLLNAIAKCSAADVENAYVIASQLDTLDLKEIEKNKWKQSKDTNFT